MPVLRNLCGSGTIKIKDVNGVFLSRASAWKFNAELQELVDVLAPMAKSITCLESTHSTVSDVYVFWLACMAGVYDAITSNSDSMSLSDKDTIREAAQARWLQMIEHAPCDVYFAGFMLDPRFRNHDILHDLNPLTIKGIKIPSQNPNSNTKDKLPKSVKRLGDFLLSILRIEYEQKGSPIAGLPVAQALDNLKDQIPSYIKGSYLFKLPLSPSEDPLEWWKRLDEDSSRKEAVQPLAFLARGIFAVTPNSMADERTQSTYTWLNSNLRNRQSVQTVTWMIQIRNWYLQQRKADNGGLGSKSKAARAPGVSQSEVVIVDNDSEDEYEDGDIGDLLDSDSEAEGSEERPDSDDDDSEDLDAVVYEDLEAAVKGLNLESWMLKDYLSDTAIAPDTAVKGKGKGKGKATAEGRATRELGETDWKM
ncbi:hypothetical protein GSI_08044 [Ganoderma sinense ZZ0214-1]|uniref:Uncharacterized protein n=1 Tax=Ganoderma sinense ZZ0214-1 TaxID=1077348 RepID=A0A2G8S7X8_9APHY|nr:hypothetical protein GSI_08044 [Ganoderma sinense ZZ0214-1]